MTRDLKADLRVCTLDGARCTTLRALVDTGATRSVLRTKDVAAIGLKPRGSSSPVMTSITGESVNGSVERMRLHVDGSRGVELGVSVVPDDKAELPLIGMDVLSAAHCTIDAARRKLVCAAPVSRARGPRRRRR